MKVAVIVVNYNDTEDTIAFVNCIAKYQTIQKIVVVDNLSSQEDTMEKLRDLESSKVHVLQAARNGGYNYGNNVGIRFLEEAGDAYDAMIISNPDIEVEEKAIERCLAVLEQQPDVAVAAPRMYNASCQPIRRSSWKIRTFGLDVIHSARILELLFYPKLRSGEYREADYENACLEVEAISGAFFIIQYDVLKEIGLLDENVFLFYEEDILATKLREKGYKVVSVNDVKFVHYESQAIGKTLSYYKKMKQLYQSKLYYQKNYHHIRWWQIGIFWVLNIWRKVELLFEIPIRKILKK